MFKENKSFYLFVIGILVFMSTVVGILVGTSDVFFNSKKGLVLIICLVATAVICWIVDYKDKNLEKDFKASLAEVEKERNKYIDKTIELAKENDTLKEQLEYYTASPTDENTLKAKYDALARFQSGFPYQIAEGYKVYSIMRINLQTDKASTWQIVGEYNGDLWECSIIRPHTQSHTELLTLIASTKQPTDIEMLNQSEVLLWK